MPTLEYAGIRVDVDEEGYLVNFDDWNEKVACALAEREGILDRCPLTGERMIILKFLRGYYKNFNSSRSSRRSVKMFINRKTA